MLLDHQHANGVAESNQSMQHTTGKRLSMMSEKEESDKKRKKATDEATNHAMLNKLKIGFIGSGNMARAIVEGMLLTGGTVAKKNIYTSCTRTASENYVKMQSLGVNVSTSNKMVIMNSDVIIVAVKPYQALGILDELQETYNELTAVNPLTGTPNHPPKNLRPLIVSVAAGITIEEIEEKTKITWNMGGSSMVGHLPVVRCIPSVGSSVGAGITIYTKGMYCNESDVPPFLELFRLCGHCEEVPEKAIAGLAAISGSGPAFVAVIAEAMTDGGVLVGIKKPLAQTIVAHTLASTAKLILEGKQEPSQIKYGVSSPAGTTIRGLQVLEDRGIRGTLIGAIQATAEQTSKLK